MTYTCKTCDQTLPPDGVFTYGQKPYCDVHAPFGAVRYGATTAYQCIRCSQLIPNGEVLAFENQPLCTRCAPGGSKPWNFTIDAPLAVGPMPVQSTDVIPANSSSTGDSLSIGGVLLTLLGLLCVAVGLNYLVFNPGNPGEYGLARDTINMHCLAIGQTFTLAGAIFCAAAWRPR
jgi:hypothetical protein